VQFRFVKDLLDDILDDRRACRVTDKFHRLNLVGRQTRQGDRLLKELVEAANLGVAESLQLITGD